VFHAVIPMALVLQFNNLLSDKMFIHFLTLMYLLILGRKYQQNHHSDKKLNFWNVGSQFVEIGTHS